MENSNAKMDNVYQVISAAFCVIVVVSNIISAKMVQIPFFTNLILPAGLLTYPLTFLLSDLVTEIFGAKKAKFMVYVALTMNVLSLTIIQLALILPASEHEQTAFQSILGLSGLRIISSLIAYVASQVLSIQIYAFIKNITGERFLFLRNNGSNSISQLVDTLIIDILYLYLGMGLSFYQVVPIMMVSYFYKTFISVSFTPLFYLCVYSVKLYEKKQLKYG